MPTWLEAGLWGLLGGAALVIGAAVAWFLPVPQLERTRTWTGLITSLGFLVAFAVHRA